MFQRALVPVTFAAQSGFAGRAVQTLHMGLGSLLMNSAQSPIGPLASCQLERNVMRRGMH